MTEKEYSLLENDFFSWFPGNDEDDPIPYEIKYIYLNLLFENNLSHLRAAGGEKKEKWFSSLPFYPLEWQFFFNQSFCYLEPIKAKIIAKRLLENLGNDEESIRIFHGKTIFLSVENEKPFFKVLFNRL